MEKVLEINVVSSNEFSIGLKNEVYVDSSISNVELVVLALISKTHNWAKEVALVSVNNLLDFMYCKHNNSNIAKDVRVGIQTLIDKKTIEIESIHCQKFVPKVDKKGNVLKDADDKEIMIPFTFDNVTNSTLFYVRLETLNKILVKRTETTPEVRQGFFKVLESDLDKIFKYLTKTHMDKFALVRYFIAIQRVISCDQEFGWLTQFQVRTFVGESKTVSSYNKILMDELKLIRYNNSYVTAEKQYCSTYFGAYDNEENFNLQLNSVVSVKGLISTTKINSNNKRSIKAKANRTKKIVKSTADKDRIRELEDKIKQYEIEHEKLEYKPPMVEEVKRPVGILIKPISLFQKAVKEEIDEDWGGDTTPNMEIEEEIIDFNEFKNRKELDEELSLYFDKHELLSNEQEKQYDRLFKDIKFCELSDEKLKQYLGTLERFFERMDKQDSKEINISCIGKEFTKDYSKSEIENVRIQVENWGYNRDDLEYIEQIIFDKYLTA